MVVCMGLCGCASTTLSFHILVSVHDVDTKYWTKSNLKTGGFIQDHDLKGQSIAIRKTQDREWLLSADTDA